MVPRNAIAAKTILQRTVQNKWYVLCTVRIIMQSIIQLTLTKYVRTCNQKVNKTGFTQKEVIVGGLGPLAPAFGASCPVAWGLLRRGLLPLLLGPLGHWGLLPTPVGPLVAYSRNLSARVVGCRRARSF